MRRVAYAGRQQSLSSLGELFSSTSFEPTRRHLGSIRRMMKGHLHREGSRQRSLQKNRYDNDHNVAEYGTTLAIQVFEEFHKQDPQMYNSLCCRAGCLFVTATSEFRRSFLLTCDREVQSQRPHPSTVPNLLRLHKLEARQLMRGRLAKFPGAEARCKSEVAQSVGGVFGQAAVSIILRHRLTCCGSPLPLHGEVRHISATRVAGIGTRIGMGV